MLNKLKNYYKIRTNIRNNKKIAYVKLNKKYLAIDVATKLGLM